MMYYLSFSLPKTGTTYLGNILKAIGPQFSVSNIKEPSFFIDNQFNDKGSLSRIISSGNYNRGYKWYESLFQHSSNFCFDLSTQYWIQPKQTLNYALRHIDPSNLTVFTIRRDPIEQLVSYIGQLRRGYLNFESLASLLQKDTAFADYLVKMHEWSGFDKASFFADFNVNFIEVDFNELISNPVLLINKLCKLDLSIQASSLSSAGKNQRCKPRLQVINQILFSTKLKNKMKAYTPSSIYPFLVNLRKHIVKVNLVSDNNSDCFYSLDKRDLQEFLGCH